MSICSLARLADETGSVSGARDFFRGGGRSRLVRAIGQQLRAVSRAAADVRRRSEPVL